MKYLSIIFLIITFLFACNTNEQKPADPTLANDSSRHDSSATQSNVKEIAPTFKNVDPKTAELFHVVIDKYLQVKNALANNNEDEAKKAGKELYESISKIDKQALPDEQRKVYGSEEEDLKENAEHIGKSNIDHQREHFSYLSQSIYVLARSFGSGRSLYHLFCSRVGNGEGAMWLSETIDSNNPYLGKEANCNEVIEKIK